MAGPFFRSYAGMTRIRFKGPAQRRLSTVRCTPRNGRNLCKAAALVNSARCGVRRGQNEKSGGTF
jgi:hypothetical protein